MYLPVGLPGLMARPFLFVLQNVLRLLADCDKVYVHVMFYFWSAKLEAKVIHGSCLCGAVKFQLTSEPSVMGTCHCSRCRKAGASTVVFVKKDDVVWLDGKDRVVTYQPEPPYKYGRCFCDTCGTSFGEILADADSFPIAANALDTPFDLKVQFHESVSEKPHWYEICDDAPQSSGHPS